MRVLTQAELSRMTRTELMALLRRAFDRVAGLARRLSRAARCAREPAEHPQGTREAEPSAPEALAPPGRRDRSRRPSRARVLRWKNWTSWRCGSRKTDRPTHRQPQNVNGVRRSSQRRTRCAARRKRSTGGKKTRLQVPIFWGRGAAAPARRAGAAIQMHSAYGPQTAGESGEGIMR